MNINNYILAILIAFAIMMHPTINAQVIEQDSLALVAFYNSTGGPNWTNNTGWLTGPASTWYGVTVDDSRVIKLIIYNNNMVGNIPSEIGDLSALQVLSLGNDDGLSGEIPPEVYQLSNLKILGFYNCLINGTISNEIGNLVNLIELGFRETMISGSIPPGIGNLDRLQYLELTYNQLSGPIPQEIGNCTNLWELNLNNNLLSGPIPTELSNCNQIYFLDLSSNMLEGDIPSELADVTSYLDMFFHNNHLTGIPPWDNNWFLGALWIQDNRMTFEDLEPHFVGWYNWYNYSPQDSTGQYIDTLLAPGSKYAIYSGTQGEYTTYYWTLNGDTIPDTENADTLKMAHISAADTGTYICYARNSLCTGPSSGPPMELIRRPVHIRLDTIASKIDEADEFNKLSVYPNPCGGTLTIVTRQGGGLLTVNDLHGRILIQLPILPNSMHTMVNLQLLKPGVYLLHLNQPSSVITRKIIIN